jgi:hypothetical protein
MTDKSVIVKKRIVVELQKSVQRKLASIGAKVLEQIDGFLYNDARVEEEVLNTLIRAIRKYTRTLLGIESSFGRLEMNQESFFAQKFKERIKAVFNQVVEDAGWTKDRFDAMVKEEIKKQVCTKKFEQTVATAIKSEVAESLWDVTYDSPHLSSQVLENILSNLDLEIVIDGEPEGEKP